MTLNNFHYLVETKIRSTHSWHSMEVHKDNLGVPECAVFHGPGFNESYGSHP